MLRYVVQTKEENRKFSSFSQCIGVHCQDVSLSLISGCFSPNYFPDVLQLDSWSPLPSHDAMLITGPNPNFFSKLDARVGASNISLPHSLVSTVPVELIFASINIYLPKQRIMIAAWSQKWNLMISDPERWNLWLLSALMLWCPQCQWCPWCQKDAMDPTIYFFKAASWSGGQQILFAPTILVIRVPIKMSITIQ